jgi:phage terminase Nu1 subunit (DNA packaging protein)
MQPTQTQIASALGLTQGRIAQLKKAGMPMDSIPSARRWHEDRIAARPSVASAAAQEPRTPSPRKPPEDYRLARARRESAEADMAERKAAELSGELVRRSLIVAAAERKANAVKESLLQLPAQLAPVVAVESDIAKCQDILMDAVLDLLARIGA